MPLFMVQSNAATDSYIELNEDRIAIDKNSALIAITRVIIYIKDKDSLQLIRDKEFKVDATREAVELLEAKCHMLTTDGQWSASSCRKEPQLRCQTGKITEGMRICKLEYDTDEYPVRIEYAIETTRRSILFKNYFWSMNTLSADMPVKKASLEVALPEDVQLFYMTDNIDSEPVVRRNDSRVIYRWEQNELPAHSVNTRNIEATMPRSIFISSTADWRPLAQYFADEYEKKTNIPKGSNDVIFELTGQSVDIIRTMPATSIIETIKRAMNDFVKVSSADPLIPLPAKETMVRKRGDCKDLAVLFVSALRMIGVESYVVLINKELQMDIETMLPYPYIFNHALVYVPAQDVIKQNIIIDPVQPMSRVSMINTKGLVLKKDYPYFVFISNERK